MKWDREKAIHQKLVGEIQLIQAKMDVLAQLYPDTSKDIQRLTINTKEGLEQNWEALPYHQESKEKESCNDTRTKSTKANK
jgi:hypothetical protein